MTGRDKPKYYLVEAGVLPEVFTKVTEARELLETGEVRTVADAVERVGISRSAFYKYKDSVMPFRDMRQGSIVTFNALLRDKKGVLSSLLAIFADSGANILTINQSIPTNGTAFVTISAITETMAMGMDELIAAARALYGVIRFDALAG
ncbi:MAG TPA: ACT domain-containing protein [Candidatus Scatomorpha stercoravium]|nr:ACT domain-containing protein [Candidatus Scatomorpha stercoravium]